MQYSKIFILLFVTFATSISYIKAQGYKKIFFNLYTDSLKKGTYNYINVDGMLENGSYLPLDTTAIKFWSSDGKFYGNSLFIDPKFNKDKVIIRITTRNQPEVTKEVVMYIKKAPEGPLKTSAELLEEMKASGRKSKKDSSKKIKTKEKESLSF